MSHKLISCHLDLELSFASPHLRKTGISRTSWELLSLLIAWANWSYYLATVSRAPGYLRVKDGTARRVIEYGYKGLKLNKLETFDKVRFGMQKLKLSNEVLIIQQLGEQHRAIRQVLESCELILDDETYESLADLHDSLVAEKRKLLEKALRQRKSPALTLVPN